jgi:hypothetical protein
LLAALISDEASTLCKFWGICPALSW